MKKSNVILWCAAVALIFVIFPPFKSDTSAELCEIALSIFVTLFPCTKYEEYKAKRKAKKEAKRKAEAAHEKYVDLQTEEHK